MRVLIVGTNGEVGKAAVGELAKRHDVVTAGRKTGDVRVDLLDAASIGAMFEKVGKIDAVVACAGHAYYGPLATMTQDQFMLGLKDKLMGQVNLVLLGTRHVNDRGSFTLTSGVLDRDPILKGANGATVNAALKGFVTSAAIELERGIRINVVSPGLLQASTKKYDGLFPGHESVSSARVGLAYAKSVEGAVTGQVIIIA
jgi:NAD(P)-dependent dehydrogenase (short-subunit alcohol dehydrogenase family)